MPDTLFKWAIQPYERSFKTPLKTSHGTWAIRRGLFVALQCPDSGELGLGEVSPLPWFGTETVEDAIAITQSWPKIISREYIDSIVVPASQFGWGTALETLHRSRPATIKFEADQICGLLPTGAQALTTWTERWQSGHRTLKWKIGVRPLEEELALFETLMAELPTEAKVRLDANGGLAMREAIAWLKVCDAQVFPKVEYLEQPLPLDQFTSLKQLAEDFDTPIALDESVATLTDLRACADQDWPGLYVCKLAIMGFPWLIRAQLSQIPNPKVFSSVFEAQIGKEAALNLAAEIGVERALGFGVDHWLAESPKVSINSSTFS